jgi:hypothetical protein
MQSSLGFGGTVGMRLIRGYESAPLLWKIKNAVHPRYWLGWLANKVARLFSLLTGIPTLTAELRAVVIDGNRRIDYGIVSYRVITTAFVNFVVDQLQTETSVFGDFKFHDSGVGTTDPAIGDTGIETTDGESRVTGSQTESAANVYRSVGTITYSTSKAITEHGLFNDVSAGTLMDRSEFAAINVVNGNQIEYTYDLTVSAGG